MTTRTVKQSDDGMVHVRAARTPAGRYVVTELRITGADITPAVLRRIDLGRVIADLNVAAPADAPARLTRPDGIDPGRFYRQVADAYSTHVRQTSRPAKVIADAAGVPVATVHRWIREARRRGLLAPARRGVAG